MGSRGPAAKPTNVHLLNSNPGHKRLGQLLGEFKPEIEIPDAPPWLWSEAKREWKRIGPLLEKDGLIALIDRAALVLYTQAWAEFVWAKKALRDEMRRVAALKAAHDRRQAAELEKAEAVGVEHEAKPWMGGDGFQVPTPNGGFTYSPYWVAAQRAGAEVHKYLAAFGMSPSARARVTTSDNRQGTLFGEPNKSGSDEWEEL